MSKNNNGKPNSSNSTATIAQLRQSNREVKCGRSTTTRITN